MQRYQQIRHRQRILKIAKKYCSTITAIWLNTPLKVALQRNVQRSIDKQVPENAVISVFNQLEPATKEEGFSNIIIVTCN